MWLCRESGEKLGKINLFQLDLSLQVIRSSRAPQRGKYYFFLIRCLLILELNSIITAQYSIREGKKSGPADGWVWLTRGLYVIILWVELLEIDMCQVGSGDAGILNTMKPSGCNYSGCWPAGRDNHYGERRGRSTSAHVQRRAKITPWGYKPVGDSPQSRPGSEVPVVLPGLAHTAPGNRLDSRRWWRCRAGLVPVWRRRWDWAVVTLHWVLTPATDTLQTTGHQPSNHYYWFRKKQSPDNTVTGLVWSKVKTPAWLDHQKGRVRESETESRSQPQECWLR